MLKQPKQRSHQQKQYVYHVSRRSSDDQPLDELLEQFWKIEAEGTQPEPESKNPVEKEALDILNKTISYNGEKCENGLPWKKPLRIENNYFAALSQLKSLQKRLSNDLQLKELYEQTLTTDLQKFYVKPVEMQQPEPEKIWYLPHHPVVNPNKPGKVRRVANAAAKFRGQSLNSNLITGPDLLNNLVGILLRFCENPVAILSDIDDMFMQIAIRHEDQCALRFLWPNEEMVNQYQFTRLIFGANCSPFCAIFVLNRCAEDKAIEFPTAVNAIKNHFYMDDYIHSLASIEEAIDTINQTKDSLHKGGFRLTKFVSNKHEALRFIEQEDRDELKEINRVLGQKWNTRTDCFLMKTLEHFPRNASEYTQRKMFSLVSTFFDPLGILSPLTIRIKMLLQQVWKLGKKWDEPLPAELHSYLKKVLDSYFAMPDIEIPRWLNSSTNQENNHQLHVFVDASTVALSAVAYIRTQKQNTKTPIKPVLDPNRFSTWNKLLLTLATVFNLIYRAKKNRSDKSQYTKDDVCLSQNFLLKLSQNNAFSSTINAIKRTQKLDAKSKLRNLNPIIDQNGLLRSSGRLLFAPTEYEIEKCPIILDAKEKIARLIP